MPKRESLIGVCVERAARALIAENLAAGRDPSVKASRVETGRVLWQSTRLGSSVAALIVEWALALDDLGRVELGIEAFAEWASVSRRTAYRRMDDFHRVFPDQPTPNGLAWAVLREARSRGQAPKLQTLVPA